MLNPRLEQAVTLIARHVEYSGKQALVQGCLNEIEDRYRQGLVDFQEKSRLIGILLGRDAETVAD